MNSASGIGFGSSAVQNAQLGISRGLANFTRDAQIVAQSGGLASSGASTGGLDATTGALVDAQQQALDVKASAAALSIADQTLGTLLDVKA
jgi:hypothetical protein